MWRRSLLVAVLVTVNCFSSCIASAWGRGLHADSQNAISMEHKSKAVWKAQWHHVAGVSVSNQRLVHLLGPLLQYDYTLPKSQVRRGLTYFGSGHRLRRAVRKLLTGTKPMKIGLLGGSISWGQGASKRGVTDWFSVFSRWAVSAALWRCACGCHGYAGQARGLIDWRVCFSIHAACTAGKPDYSLAWLRVWHQTQA